MTESSTDLVARYRALPFPSDHLVGCEANHEKCEILRRLDDHASEAGVGQLLLDILTSSAEHDLARIEAAVVVGLYVDDSSPLERQLKRQLWRIVADRNEDVLVRQHVSQRIQHGFGGESEHEIIERLLFDEQDDLDVRHGAFDYLKSAAADATFVNRLIPRLRRDEYWSKYQKAIPDTRPV